MARRNFISDFFFRRQMRQTFGHYITPETANALLKGEGLEVAPLRPVVADFVLVLFEQTHFPQVLQAAAKIVHECGGLVETLSGPLMLVTFFPQIERAPAVTAEKRLALVEAIARQLGTEVCLLHGQQAGYYGAYGGNSRFAFGTVFHDHASLLRELLAMTPGEVRVWRAQSSS
jgi:hypothetical protein